MNEDDPKPGVVIDVQPDPDDDADDSRDADDPDDRDATVCSDTDGDGLWDGSGCMGPFGCGTGEVLGFFVQGRLDARADLLSRPDVVATLAARTAARRGELETEITAYRSAIDSGLDQPYWVYRNLGLALWNVRRDGEGAREKPGEEPAPRTGDAPPGEPVGAASVRACTPQAMEETIVVSLMGEQ